MIEGDLQDYVTIKSFACQTSRIGHLGNEGGGIRGIQLRRYRRWMLATVGIETVEAAEM